MWTSTLELTPSRVIPTYLLGLFWRGAYFSSLAPLQIQNLPRQPLPSTSWVRVRNRLAGIGGNELHQIYGNGDFRISPAALPRHTHTYPGKEVVGEVIEVGEDVQQLGVGDRVVLQHAPNCLTAGVQPLCRSCAAGNYNLCESGILPDPQQIGGGWSEEMLLHEQQLYLTPATISDEQALMLQPTAIALRAVLHSFPQVGDRILIIGSGTIGLMILNIVRALAPETEVSILAKHAFQVEQATRMGAAHIVYPNDSYTAIQHATGARLYKGMLGNQTLLGGYDIIYDTIGDTSTIHDSLRWARAQANVVMVGLNPHLMRIDLSPIWNQEVNLIGTTGHGMENWPVGSRAWRSTFDIAAELIQHGLVHPERLITHRFALNNYREALTTAANKSTTSSIKVAFDYALQPASVVPNVRATARSRRPLTASTRNTSSQLGDLAPSKPQTHVELPFEKLEPAPSEPRVTAEPRSGQPQLDRQYLHPLSEELDVTAKAPIPTSEQLARRKEEKVMAPDNQLATPPAQSDQQGRGNESTLRFKRPNLRERQKQAGNEKQAHQENLTPAFPPAKAEAEAQPIPLATPEVVEAQEPDEDSVTITQPKPVVLPEIPARTKPEDQEPTAAQAATHTDEQTTLPEQMEEPISATEAEPVATFMPSEQVDEPEATTVEASTSYEQVDEPEAITVEAPTSYEQVDEPEEPEATTVEAPTSSEQVDEPEATTVEAPTSSEQVEEPEAITVEASTPSEQVDEAGEIFTPIDEDEVAEPEAIEMPASPEPQASEAETVQAEPSWSEQISSLDTVQTPVAPHPQMVEDETGPMEASSLDQHSPEQFEFAGSLTEKQEVPHLPELIYEPETNYVPEPDFDPSADHLEYGEAAPIDPDSDELNIDYREVAGSSEPLPSPESYETTIFDIPQDEQLNWLSSMQDTQKEEAVEPPTNAATKSVKNGGSRGQSSNSQAPGKQQPNKSNKAKKRRR